MEIFPIGSRFVIERRASKKTEFTLMLGTIVTSEG